MRTRTLAAIILLLAIALIAGCSDSADDFSGFIFPPPQGPPQAANDAYTALGNSPLNVTPAQGVLVNDPAPAPVTAFQNPSAQGGAVNVNADGSLTYTPPTGFVGQDTFTYTATNAAGASQATVTVTLNQLAWYVNNAGANGDGSRATPFNTLAAALAAAGPGDIVFVFRGNGTNAGLAGAVALQNGQQLIGEGAGLNFNNGINPRADSNPSEGVLAQQIVAPGQFPVLTGPVTLADGNVVSGLRVENTAGSALAGTGINGTTITGNQLVNPTLTGVTLANATGTLLLSGNTVSGTGGIGFDLQFASVNATLVVENNQFTNTGDRSINFVATGTAQVAATFGANAVTSSGPGGSGIEMVARNTAVLDLAVTGNTVNNAQSAGIGLDTFDGSRASASFLGNTVNGAVGQGLRMAGSETSSIAAEVRNNVLTGNNPNFGFEADVLDAATQCLDITGNTTDRFNFRQNDTAVLRVEQFSNLVGLNLAGTVAVLNGAVTEVAADFCGF